jgi:hypothetical protein
VTVDAFELEQDALGLAATDVVALSDASVVEVGFSPDPPMR